MEKRAVLQKRNRSGKSAIVQRREIGKRRIIFRGLGRRERRRQGNLRRKVSMVDWTGQRGRKSTSRSR
eukprot:5652607-Ditylum_brightwellii.AAC.1